MSHEGIMKTAGMFQIMQEVRIQLLASGDNQDIMLAQLLEDAKEATKERFAEITMIEDTP